MSEDRFVANTVSPGFSARRILVFAPHPDDEVFGCGGALARAVKAGADIRVVIISDGSLGQSGPTLSDALRSQRERESCLAAEIIGYPPPKFLQHKDRSLRFNQSLLSEIHEEIVDFSPELVLTPSFTEVHPDHRAVAQSVLAASESIAAEAGQTKESPDGLDRHPRFDVAFYEVGQPLRPNLLIDTGPVYEVKRAAMMAFSSQLSEKSYARLIEALNVYRTYTLDAKTTHAEAFFLVSHAALANRDHGIWLTLKRNDRAIEPLVAQHDVSLSVIMPCSASPLFLQSLASQSYSAVEWIPVGDRSFIAPRWLEFFPILPKPEYKDDFQNALDHAAGDWILFCSGAWGFKPQHIERLLSLVRDYPSDDVQVFGLISPGERRPRSEALLVSRSLLPFVMDRCRSPSGFARLLDGSIPEIFFGLGEHEVNEDLSESIRSESNPYCISVAQSARPGVLVHQCNEPLTLFRIDPDQVTSRLTDFHIRLQLLTTQLSIRDEEVNTAQLTLKGMKWTINHHRDEVDRLTAELSERIRAYDRLHERLRTREWEVAHLADDLAAVKADATALFSTQQKSQADLEASQARLESAQADLEAAKVNAGQLFEEKQQALEQLTVSSKRQQKSQADLEASQARLESTQADLEASQARLESTQADLEASQARLESTQARLESTQADLEALLLQLPQLEAAKAEANRLLEQAKQLLEEEQASLRQLETHLHRSYAYITHLETDIAWLKQTLMNKLSDLEFVQDDARLQFARVQMLASELHQIRNSRAWRAIQGYRRFRFFLKHGPISLTTMSESVPTSNRVWQGLIKPWFRPFARSMIDRFRTGIWAKLPIALKQVLRSYLYLWRGQLWIPTSKQNLASLRSLTDARMQWLKGGGLSISSLSGSIDLAHSINATRVDIQLVLYESAGWMPAWVRSLFNQKVPLSCFNLIVVDHRPGDGSARALLAAIDREKEALGQSFASVQVIEQANLGFGAGHNRALRAGRSPWVLVVNPDLEFEPESIHEVLRVALADHTQVACWEFRQKPYEHPKHYDPVTGLANWVSHACVLMRRSAIESIGGWESRLFMYCEDVAMSYRLREAGHQLRYCPRAVVWHRSYGDPTEVKRAQYVGSAVGQVFLRLRFGTWQDAWVAAAVFMHRMLTAPASWRREIFQKGIGILGRFPGLRAERLWYRPKNPVYFPFRGLDYELRRAGDFVFCEHLAILRKSYEDHGGMTIEDKQDFQVAESFNLVSIITRTYGGLDGKHRLGLLRQAACCIAQQTWPNLEWLVVEDGAKPLHDDAAEGTTPTAHFIGMFATANPQVKVKYLSSPGGGRSAAGNLGLAEAKGCWIGFLDDDDLLYADHVETLMQALIKMQRGHKQADEGDPRPVVAAYARAFDLPSRISREDKNQKEPSSRTSADIDDLIQLQIEDEEAFMHPGHDRSFDSEALQAFNYLPIQTVLFHRRLIDERGGFDQTLDQLEDWNLWVRYAENNRFIYVPKTTSMYRTPSDPKEKARRQALLDSAYGPVREKNHVFRESLRAASVPEG